MVCAGDSPLGAGPVLAYGESIKRGQMHYRLRRRGMTCRNGKRTQEMGCGSGMTGWRRLREWQEVAVWQRLHVLLLAKLHEAERIDWSRATP